MKTTIHHVADCGDCRRSTLHQTVVEHGPDRRAVSKRAECQRCAQHLDARDTGAPVLDLINARSIRERYQESLAAETDLGAIAN